MTLIRRPYQPFVVVTFCKNAGTASTTTTDDLGRASIKYVNARQAWFICEREKGKSRVWILCDFKLKRSSETYHFKIVFHRQQVNLMVIEVMK